jgi:hypothetical protein
VVKRAPAKKGPLTAINAAATATPVADGEHAREVVDEMPEKYVSIFLSGKVCGELECLCGTVHPRDGLLRWHAKRSIH